MKRKLLIVAALLFSSVLANAQSWTIQSSNFSATGTYPFDISVVDSNTAWAVGRDGAGTNISIQEYTVTTNGGTAWTAGSVTTDTNMAFSGISATSGTVAYAMMFNNTAGSGGGIYKTTNGGAVWNQLSASTIFNASSFPDIIYFRDANNGLAIGDPNGPGTAFFEIYQTSDAGTTWTRVPTANIPAPNTGEYGIINDYAVNGTNVWFGTNKGRVYHSANNGLNWTVANCGPAANTVTGLAFIDSNVGLATSATTAGVTTLYRSTNGGTTWTSVTTHTGPLYLNTLKNIPGTLTFVSCGASTAGRGSSYSTNQGNTWVAIDTSGAGTTDGYTEIEFKNSNIGWAGGFTVDANTDGIYKWIPGGTIDVKPVAEMIGDMNAYPNPSSGIVRLKVKLVNRGDMTIRVTDLLGNVVYSNIQKNSPVLFEKTLDLRNLAKGIYVLNVECGASRSTEKIVIQ